jgi:diaminopimelate epimerase
VPRIFPRFTNVQLAAPVGRRALQVLIWERGAGETLASGSSACAAASAAVRLGLVRSPVEVRMHGGALRVEVGADYAVTLDGPVAEVARGRFSPEFLRALRRDVG